MPPQFIRLLFFRPFWCLWGNTFLLNAYSHHIYGIFPPHSYQRLLDPLFLDPFIYGLTFSDI